MGSEVVGHIRQAGSKIQVHLSIEWRGDGRVWAARVGPEQTRPEARPQAVIVSGGCPIRAVEIIGGKFPGIRQIKNEVGGDVIGRYEEEVGRGVLVCAEG